MDNQNDGNNEKNENKDNDGITITHKIVSAPFDPSIYIKLEQVVENDITHRKVVEVNDNDEYKIIIHPKITELLKTGYIKQRTEKWLQSRQKKITASKVDTIIRADNSKTKDSMFKVEVGISPKFKGNIYTEHGMLYEPIAIHRYQMFTKKMGLKFGLIPHPKYHFIGGSPDLITLDGILVEIKCPYKRNSSRIDNLKRYIIPPQYMSQVQLLLEITGLEVAHYVEYYLPDRYNKEELYVVEINRNREWFSKHIGRMESWFHRLDTFYREKHHILSTYLVYRYKYKRDGKISNLINAYYYWIKYRRLMEKTRSFIEERTMNKRKAVSAPALASPLSVQDKKRMYQNKNNLGSNASDWRNSAALLQEEERRLEEENRLKEQQLKIKLVEEETIKNFSVRDFSHVTF